MPETTSTDISPKRHRGRKLMLLAGLAVMSLSAGQMSLAIFTDQETVPATFSTGSIILDDVKIDALTLTTSAMMPGDTVTDDVVVENDGSSQLRYAVSASTTNPDTKDLRSQLTLTVKGVDVDGITCGSFDGTSILAFEPACHRRCLDRFLKPVDT